MLMSAAIKAQHQSGWNNKLKQWWNDGKVSKTWGKKKEDRRAGRNPNTAPSLGQISPDLSVYQNPISELYVSPSRHQRVLWLIKPQFPHRLAAFQSTRPSQSLTTDGLIQPRKGNSSSLSSSRISIGDPLDPSSTLIGFSGVPWMGTGGGDGDWNEGRTGRGLGEGSRARPLWFFLKCIQSRRNFLVVRTSSKSIVAFTFCFCISCSIRRIVEWIWSMVSIFWKAMRPSNSPMSSLKFLRESKIVNRDSRFRVCWGCNI